MEAFKGLLQVESRSKPLIPPVSCTNACSVMYQRSSFETQHSKILLGAGHGGILGLAPTQIPDSQKESRYLT